MEIIHKAGNVHKNVGGVSRWEPENMPDNPDYLALEAEPQIPIKRINTTYTWTEFFEEVRESYKKDGNFHILTCLLDKDYKDTALVN
ncbi:hypothetical protein O181_034035 [Austropuccinia psidii MF-1]|uniref:Uncharacterized protein n=1 Tax=Austropuccinia psidii MF-1 TaxID=1389203 RepID=A0A9Q3H9T0_9BASI|nr:hypothetical protein [Austropuccinia psidii MF-1]